jgi:hypothetical protein
MKPQSDARKERLAAALRENLRRRKTAAKKDSTKPRRHEEELHRAPTGGPQAATKQP